MFDRMKELMAMQNKMQQAKRELDETIFEVSSSDGILTIAMNGVQDAKSVSIHGDLSGMDKSKLEQSLCNTYNKAVKRSQEIAAKKMKDIAGLNIPGL